MDADFWLERWEMGQTRFNQAAPNRLLTETWPRLALRPGCVVFVPLCGKSVDMVWLAERGHSVIGVELSEIAVTEFFAENGLVPDVREDGRSKVFTAGDYQLWCGDIFDMAADALTAVEAVYDRASLVALPPALRRRYATHLAAILPSAVTALVVAFEYDQAEMDGPPFAVTREQIADLFAGFDLRPLADDDGLDPNGDLAARGLTRLRETAVELRREG
jgi:thiopurine S-methyltransferase